MYQIVYILSLVSIALLSGLFYGFQFAVIKGLGNLSDKEYLLAFQSINREIQNPYFFISFLGSIFLLPICSYLSFIYDKSQQLPYVILATIIYFVGVFGITILCNVPLNEKLELFNISSSTDFQLKEMRTSFEQNWNNWHLIRTIASIIAFIVLTIPLFNSK